MDQIVKKHMVPIDELNIYTLKPGEWIWDSKLVERRAHKRSLYDDKVIEPGGFMLVHILDLKCLQDPCMSKKPFMLMSIEDGYNWYYLEKGRFYMFRFREEKENG